MNEEDRRLLQLQKEMEFRKNLGKAQTKPLRAEGYQSLDRDVHRAKGTPLEKETITRIPDSTQRIDTKTPMKTRSIDSFWDNINSKLKGSKSALKGVGNKLKAIPVLGGALAGAAALSSGDVEAGVRSMIPFIGDANDLGPDKDSLGYKLEQGTITPEERKLLEEMYLNNQREL